jgi:cysteinyl-tRNA synthetase
VDDKIILRGRQQHLLSEFTSKHPNLDDTVVSTATEAFDAYVRKNLFFLPPDLKPEAYDTEAKKVYQAVLDGKSLAGNGIPAGDKEAKIKMHLKTASSAAAALNLVQNDKGSMDVVEFYTRTEDVLLPYLDSLYGSSIDASDYRIFTKLTSKFEKRFFEDVRALNCLDPDVLTRVTEYCPQIVEFVKKIEANGFAYVTSDGSVYFNISTFENHGHHYARLEPWNRDDKDLQADGEGALTKKTTEKRGDGDFALWKASKPGEPSWPSPWGPGLAYRVLSNG